MNSDDRQRALAAYIQKDTLARLPGIVAHEVKPGWARASMTVTEDMLNFHGLTRGGAVGALSDAAFAAASNSHGQVAVGISINMSLLRATRAAAVLTAEAKEPSASGPLGLHEIITRDETGDLVARTQAQVYRKREHFL